MMNRELQTALDRVARRVSQHTSNLWLAAILLLIAIWATVRYFEPTADAILPRSALLVLLTVVDLIKLGWDAWEKRDQTRLRRRAAERVEASFPDLDSRLFAALGEDARQGPGRVVGYLPSAVIRETLEHQITHDWTQVISTARNRRVKLAQFVLITLTILLFWITPQPHQADSPAAPLAVIEGRATAADIQVDPGDAEVERGMPLLVVARFGSNVPASAQLLVESSEPTPPTLMARSLEDPTFAGRIESVNRELTYRVAFDGQTSPTYRVKVFTFPEVRKVDAHLTYPSYTGLDSKTLEDVRHVTAVEGTTLGLTFRLNKEVASARLVDEKGNATPLELVAGPPPVNKAGEAEPIYQAGWVLAESHKYKVELTDRDGRKNKTATDLSINVTINRPATIALSAPGRDVRVSPVEEFKVQAKTEDDFGVIRHGINYITPGGEAVDLVLDPNGPASKKRVADHLIAMENLKAQPDQLVSYFFWAEDIGPDLKPRRSSGDLFFAEVRHFEEIFRQGEAPPSSAQSESQSQNGQQAEKLAELQKQIIAATWKLVRRETGAKPTAAFAADAGVVRESQASAIEQAGPMAQALRDPTSKANLQAAVKAMKEAESHLAGAAEGPSIDKLRPALAAEQAAYQALLKLRAREFEVARQRSRQQQGGGGGSASQQQLNELELSNDENRYEEQKSAKSPQNATKAEAEKRETRQVLNRLAELARRQTDLNERLKELQAALEAAKTPEAKAEADRQLKRLRDQEQQILRDTDEVRERMEREENRDRMAEARPEIDKGREQVRQAAEALEEGKVSQALNEGTRAERQLKDLREDLRKKSSERFGEDVGQMREQARKLSEEQTKLTDQLARWEEQTKRSLRDPEAKQKVGESLTRQKKDLDGLLDQMKSTVTEAEETEPLLAKELFDAVRKAGEKAIPKDLDEADQLAQAGLPDEAARSSRQAGEGLDGLKEGVERAARSILGDESAALKRAQNELEDLADQANRGLARADSPNTRRAASPNGQPGDPSNPQAGGQPGANDPAGSEPGRSGLPKQGQSNQIGRSSSRQDPQNRQPGQGQEPGEGQQPGDQPGKDPQPGQGRQPGQAQGQQEGQGQQPGQGESQQPGQGQAEGQQPGQGQGRQPGQGQQPGQGRNGQASQGRQSGVGGQQPGEAAQGQEGQGQGQPGGQNQGQRGGQRPGGGQGGGAGGGNQPNDLNRQLEEFAPASGQPNPGGQPQGGGNGGGGGGGRERSGVGGTNRGEGVNPITGDGFRQWSDRLRDVEELLTNPDLRAEAARIRDRARGAREEARRHAQPLDPGKLKEMVADPILELRNRVAEEVRRRESPDALVPIDRDPVPPRFAEGVRRYYERLGSGR